MLRSNRVVSQGRGTPRACAFFPAAPTHDSHIGVEWMHGRHYDFRTISPQHPSFFRPVQPEYAID